MERQIKEKSNNLALKGGRIIKFNYILYEEIIVYKWEFKKKFPFLFRFPVNTKKCFKGIEYEIPGELGRLTYLDTKNSADSWNNMINNAHIIKEQLEIVKYE